MTRKKQSLLGLFLILIVLALFLFFLLESKDNTPVKFGFIGCLTGRLSDLGIAGRDGALLAAEKYNEAGGINGRRIELIIKDDQQDAETAVRGVKELIDEDVVAIIGHMTSTMSLSSLSVINKARTVMMSPTTSTNDINEIDDFFFRVMQPNWTETRYLAEYAINHLKVTTMASVYDLSNRAFSEEWLLGFKREFNGMGGKFTSIEPFDSGTEIKHSKLAANIIKSNPEAVLLVTGSLDAAMICQQLRKAGSKIPVISAGWAMTDDFLRHGGSAVEGVVFSQIFDANNRSDRYLEFKNQFFSRFGRYPDFGSIFSYEAAEVLFKSFAKSPEKELLKQSILKTKTFQGLQGEIVIDAYGDARRKRFLIKVEDNQFKTVD